jgi:hypothetical protein
MIAGVQFASGIQLCATASEASLQVTVFCAGAHLIPASFTKRTMWVDHAAAGSSTSTLVLIQRASMRPTMKTPFEVRLDWIARIRPQGRLLEVGARRRTDRFWRQEAPARQPPTESQKNSPSVLGGDPRHPLPWGSQRCAPAPTDIQLT